mmetsp:Transcript_32252/g.96941  ORF Transcript_32252/g.96941 Transcript_32252/m.96941 type:complete len:305 (-) Transcript_32252:309-1223(-)
MIVEWTPTIGTPARVPVEDGLRRTTLDFDRPGERAGAREHRAHRVPVAVEVVVVSQRPLFRHGGAASAPRRRRDPGRPRSGARGAHRRLELSSGSASRRSPSVSAAASSFASAVPPNPFAEAQSRIGRCAMTRPPLRLGNRVLALLWLLPSLDQPEVDAQAACDEMRASRARRKLYRVAWIALAASLLLIHLFTLSTARTAPPRRPALVVLIGNLRGGELAWESLHRHVLAPNDADLAVLIDPTSAQNAANASLLRRATYVWRSSAARPPPFDIRNGARDASDPTCFRRGAATNDVMRAAAAPR